MRLALPALTRIEVSGDSLPCMNSYRRQSSCTTKNMTVSRLTEVFMGANEMVPIVCPVHGDFEQLPINHLLGKGCTNAGKSAWGMRNANRPMTSSPTHSRSMATATTTLKQNTKVPSI